LNEMLMQFSDIRIFGHKNGAKRYSLRRFVKAGF
jgi:hypothetical protein